MTLYIFGFLVMIIIFSYCLTFVFCVHRKKTDERKSSITLEANNDGRKEQSYLKAHISILCESLLRLNLHITSKLPSHHMRMLLYKYVFRMNIGKRVVIYYGTEIRAPWKINIGDGTIIGDKCILDGRCGISIGKNVNFSTGVWLWTLQHDLNDPFFGTDGKGGAIYIGDRAWVSCRTTILPGIRIGEGAVVAAGAVVTKDIEAYSVNGGIPSKKIDMRTKKLIYELSGRHPHFL